MGDSGRRQRDGIHYATGQADRARATTEKRICRRHWVSRVAEPADFPKLGFPPPNARMADLVLFAEDRFAFDSATDGEVVTSSRRGPRQARTGTSTPNLR